MVFTNDTNDAGLVIFFGTRFDEDGNKLFTESLAETRNRTTSAGLRRGTSYGSDRITSGAGQFVSIHDAP